MELHYNQTVERQIAEIRKKLHLRMNGEVAGMIVRSGLKYKLVYGTQLPELKALAAEYAPDAQLARGLWTLQIRETMILAMCIFPKTDFTAEQAERWAHSLLTTEMADLFPMLLLGAMPFAAEKAEAWFSDDDPLVRRLACNLLLRVGANFPERQEKCLQKMAGAMQTDGLFFKTLLALASESEQSAGRVLDAMRSQQVPEAVCADFRSRLKIYFDL